jgi:nucleoside-diphosphate-sugar epimerase
VLAHQNQNLQMPARVVIVGAGGFVGSAIAEKLAEDRASVFGLTSKEIDLLQPDAGKTLAASLRADDCVVFISALAPARNAEALMKNLVMAEQVIAGLKAQPVAHLVYISSDAVYDDAANPVTEGSCCQPSSMHGMMHAARELMLKSELKLPLAILRPSLLYGENDTHNGYGPNRFRRLAEKGDPITLFGEGEEQRDHVYIDDAARLVAAVVMHRSTGVLNIATGSSVSFREIAELVAEISGKPTPIRGTPRQNPITHRHFDITECLKAFPRFSYTPLREGLARAARASERAAS